MYKVLLVDDEAKVLNAVRTILNYKGYYVEYTASGRDALKMLRDHRYDAMLLDLKLTDISGVEVLQQTIEINPMLPVIVISGETDIVLDAVKAVQMGAYDFLKKPLSGEVLLIVLQNAINQYRLKIENQELLNHLQEQYNLVCESPAMKTVYSQIEKIAPRNAKVLILGETGVGKELVAGAIHHASQRRAKKFVTVNCAAIPKELIESELFGHKRGSFTGAHQDKIGKFILADGGTIFLDEIAELTPAAQAKLLRVLESNEVEVVGEPTPRKVDVRIIAATNRDIEKLIDEGKFRLDLYYRLNTFLIKVPPLRERREDIPLLANLLLKKSCEENNVPLKELRPDAVMLLMDYQWPGNVRELRNVMEKLVVLIDDREIKYPHVYSILHMEALDSQQREILPLKEARENFEKSYILRVLLSSNYTVAQAAEKLGIERSNLQKKMKKYGISKREITAKNSLS